MSTDQQPTKKDAMKTFKCSRCGLTTTQNDNGTGYWECGNCLHLTPMLVVTQADAARTAGVTPQAVNLALLRGTITSRIVAGMRLVLLDERWLAYLNRRGVNES